MEKYKTPQDLIFGSLKNPKFRNRICIEDALTSTKLTYSDMDLESALAASLFKNFRIQRGFTVSLLLENGLHFFAPWLGAMRMGAVVHPINYLYTCEQVLYALELCETKLLVIQERYAWDDTKNEPSLCLQLIRNKFPALYILIMHDPLCIDCTTLEKGAGCLNTFSWSHIIKFMPSYDHIALLDDTDPFQLICTSGTTGPAKAVVQHCGMFEPNVRDLIATYELTEKDRTLLINRLFHVNAQVTNFFPMVLLGGTTVLCSSKPEDILKTISAKKITYSSMIPPMLLMLLKYQSNNNSKPKLQKRTETLRFIIVGADILTVSTHKLFSDTFGIKILPGWGMTETFCWGTGTAVNGPNYWGSIGRGLPHMELKIVDPENNWEEVCDNQFGRLIVRGDNVFKNYFRNPEATDKSFAPSERWSNGWFDTGDTCRMIYKSGPVFFGGRASADSWKVRGEFVDAPKIDEYLLKFPLVEDAMAVSVIIGGETETAACVVLKKHREIPDKMLTDGVLKYCELGRIDGSLEKHIKIKKIFSVESIELGDTGKRSRKKMTELAQKIYDEKINGGIYETVGT